MHKHLSKRSPIMRAIIDKIGPLSLPEATMVEPYQALIRSIAYQQLHATAAQAILGRYLALFGDRYPTPAEIAKTKDGAMRAAGFSASKIAAIRDIGLHAENDTIPDYKTALKMSDDELIQRLTQIRGVGKWTVEMLLIFHLGREDILPVDDFGVLNGYRIAAGLTEMPKKKDFALIGQDWAPYRSLASLYFWRYADAAKEERQLEKAEAKTLARLKTAVPKKPKGLKPVKMTTAQKAAAKAERQKIEQQLNPVAKPTPRKPVTKVLKTKK